jgi:N-acetylglucosaminyl-diphospho-decaprenol L-rhamnosyltransferase
MSSTVAVINWNSGDLLQTCIESLVATTTDVDILVIDNASRDYSLDFIADFYNRVRLIGNSSNRGFAAAVNQAFEWTSTPYVLILNPDVQVLPGAVQLLEQFMDSHPWAGAAGGYVGEKYLPRAFPTVGALVRENLGLGSATAPIQSSEPIQVDQPAAAALMIRRDAYEDTGRFDERFFPAWYEDVDFCLRMKRHGWKIFFLPAAQFIHTGGYSTEPLGSERFLRAYYRNQVRYVDKHFGSLATIALRASIAAGMIGRVIERPGQMKACAKVLIGALTGW